MGGGLRLGSGGLGLLLGMGGGLLRTTVLGLRLGLGGGERLGAVQNAVSALLLPPQAGASLHIFE